MTSWIYRKPEPVSVQGICVCCSKNLQRKTYKGTFKPICRSCDNRRYFKNHPIKKVNKIWLSYKKYKKKVCELCGFIAIDKCQLDVHHVDGNHHNNDPNNLKTLCANCHRLIHKNTPVEPKLRGGFFIKY